MLKHSTAESTWNHRMSKRSGSHKLQEKSPEHTRKHRNTYIHNKSWLKATLILMAYILWLHSNKTRDFDRLLLCVFIIKLYGKRYRAPPVEYGRQTEWKSERRWWFNRIIKPLRTDMYETHCKTTPNRNKKTLSPSFIPTLGRVHGFEHAAETLLPADNK